MYKPKMSFLPDIFKHPAASFPVANGGSVCGAGLCCVSHEYRKLHVCSERYWRLYLTLILSWSFRRRQEAPSKARRCLD